MKNVFVDGYNVINSWPELKIIKDYSLDGARQKLIEMLQNYASYNGLKIFLKVSNAANRSNFLLATSRNY